MLDVVDLIFHIAVILQTKNFDFLIYTQSIRHMAYHNDMRFYPIKMEWESFPRKKHYLYDEVKCRQPR